MDLQDIFKLSKLERLKALQLFAKQLVNTMHVGSHQSAKRGSGIEFKEYKNYTVGDSLKQLDWKYFARTDHYMIKEAEVERQQESLFVLDKSFSMKLENNGVSKFNYAKAMIASLAYIADRQHDVYTLFNSSKEAADYTEFVYQTLEEKASANFTMEDMSPRYERRKKSTVFLFTDGYATTEELDTTLKKWNYAAEQVILIHLLFDAEISLSFNKQHYRFQDLETDVMIEVNTKEQLANYQGQITTWLYEVKTCCVKHQVLYHQYDGQKSLSGFMFNLVHAINQSI
jgi:uncharacterized protein (DUF58 family)